MLERAAHRDMAAHRFGAHPFVKGLGWRTGKALARAKESMQAALCMNPRLRSASIAFSG
jgi:hypothetical protein